jgi:polyisoprenoid-binding protein YceI
MLLCAGASAAANPVWNADPVHSSAEFTATHLGISHVSGIIPIKSVTLEVPASSNIPTKIQADLDPAGVDTRERDRDDDLRSAHFFEVATYPGMSFVSTAITAIDATHFTVVGDLTMHGVTKPVTLTAQYLGRMEDMKHRSHIAYEAKTTLDRTQWGMTYGNPFAGYSIDLNLSVEAIKS